LSTHSHTNGALLPILAATTTSASSVTDLSSNSHAKNSMLNGTPSSDSLPQSLGGKLTDSSVDLRYGLDY